MAKKRGKTFSTTVRQEVEVDVDLSFDEVVAHLKDEGYEVIPAAAGGELTRDAAKKMLERIIATQEFIMTIKLLLALFCGGLLGIEREQKKRPAGFRTYMLVCVGATLVMITNEFLGTRYAGIDPTRMGAQVISGIGFLGVGTIIVTGDNRVKGLTTAAGLWATACVGLLNCIAAFGLAGKSISSPPAPTGVGVD